MIQSRLLILIILASLYAKLFSQTYHMPAESLPHEGTWLQWPHQYEYGTTYRNRLDATWVAMTSALVQSEKVHIIAYDAAQQTRITNLLTAASVSMTNVDFKLFPTNDVWVRDNGPIFVKDTAGNLKIGDWGFNGWGGDYNFNLDNPIPASVGAAIGMQVVNLNSVMTVEGGSYELDGNGVLLACKTSIISQSPPLSVRNPGMSQAQAETIFSTYLGVTKFIWLNGSFTAGDVTDFHIDGFAKFLDDSTLVTMNQADLIYWGATTTDISTLYSASNINNRTYSKVYLPLTQNNVVTTYGNNLGYKGSYCNYYVANTVVLVPNYNDPNDAGANNIIQGLYPGRTVIGIDVRNLYENGGMVHCVTQQQPAASPTSICTDTFHVAVYDTTHITIFDTTHLVVYDTTHITVHDTTYTTISVTDTLVIDVVLTDLAPPNNNNAITVYPNPAHDHLVINNGNLSAMSGYSIKITTALGQIVFNQIVNQQQFYIDLSTFGGNGTYLLYVLDAQQTIKSIKEIILQ